MFNKLKLDDIRALERIAPTRVLTQAQINEDYFHDELGTAFGVPEALVKVLTTAEVSQVLKYAYEHDLPVVTRGSGTGLVGGAVATSGGIMIDTSLMKKVLDFDQSNLTVTVEAGMLLMELAAYCDQRGYQYCPDPGEKSATIGGNISTNAGGMRAVKYGVTRDAVRALTAVLPNGEIIKVGSKVVKNSSGYDLKDLIIGSEGTLAVVTQATLKIIPKPEYAISILVPFATMSQAISTVPKIIGAKVTPVAIEYMSCDTILFAEEYLGKKFPTHASDAYLLMTFDSNTQEAAISDMHTIADLCLEEGALDVLLIDTEERSASVWSARGAFLEAIKSSTDQMDECDVVVPRSAVADFILYTHEVARTVSMRIPSFGHAGDGNLHVYICRDKADDETWQDKKSKAFSMMYAKARELGGLVSGEHGIGLAKKEYLASTLGDTQIQLMKAIKRAFDPKGILNPGKVI